MAVAVAAQLLIADLDPTITSSSSHGLNEKQYTKRTATTLLALYFQIHIPFRFRFRFLLKNNCHRLLIRWKQNKQTNRQADGQALSPIHKPLGLKLINTAPRLSSEPLASEAKSRVGRMSS